MKALAEGPLCSVALALVVFAVSFPLLAVAPTNPDVGELVRLAEIGGVAHPPGFPLQSWINRAAIRIPHETGAWRLALVSLVAHAGAVALIAEALRRARAGVAARLLACAAFGFFSLTWQMGVQGEVFALAHLCIAALLLQVFALGARQAQERTVVDAVLLGVLVALAGAQQPITVTAAPAFFTSLALVLAERRHRGLRFLAAALSFAVVFAAAYGSLPLLRGADAWPDWGQLDSIGDVVRHMLRREYGTLRLGAGGAAPVANGMTAVGAVVLAELWAALLFVPFGIVALSSARARLCAVVGTLLGGALLLVVSELGGDPSDARAHLFRFSGPLVIPLALLVGLGLDRVVARRAPRTRAAVVVVCVAATAALALGNAAAVDVSRDRAFYAHRDAIARALPRDAVLLDTVHLSSGIPMPDGSYRYPVVTGMLGLEWYREHALPFVEPRVSGSAHGARALIRALLEGGLTIATTDRWLLDGTAATLEVRGPLYLARRRAGGEVTGDTVRAALAICPLLNDLDDVEARYALSVELWHDLARGYSAAAVFLRARGLYADARVSAAIADALGAGAPSSTWREGCALLEERAAALVAGEHDAAPPP